MTTYSRIWKTVDHLIELIQSSQGIWLFFVPSEYPTEHDESSRAIYNLKKKDGIMQLFDLQNPKLKPNSRCRRYKNLAGKSKSERNEIDIDIGLDRLTRKLRRIKNQLYERGREDGAIDRWREGSTALQRKYSLKFTWLIRNATISTGGETRSGLKLPIFYEVTRPSFLLFQSPPINANNCW